MTTRAYRLRRSLLALLGLGILAFAVHAVGGAEVLGAMRRCDPLAIVVAAVAIASGTVLGALNSHRIAELHGTIPFRHFLPLYWRSWAIGITLPGQVADYLSTLWQLKGRSSDMTVVAARLLVDKVVTLVLTLFLAALLPMLIGGARGVTLWLLLALATASGLAWLVSGWALAQAGRPTAQGVLASWRLRLLTVAAAARGTPARLVVGNALLTLLKLGLSGLAYWSILRSIDGATPDFLTTTATAQGAGLVAYVPISFNGLGTVEISAVGLFHMVGMEHATVLTAYLILRALTQLSAWLPAGATILGTQRMRAHLE